MATRGVILVNLGSPASADIGDVRKYLTEFLMDGRVIDKPFIFRKALVQGIIVPFHAKKSAEMYAKIWQPSGSPLITVSRNLQQVVQAETPCTVELAMRYGLPNPKQAYENLLQKNADLEEVIIVPLYPHYAMSSYETAVEYMKEIYAKNHYRFALKIVPPYYANASYINALAKSIEPFLQKNFDQILFSYHGIPVRHLYKSDPTHGKHFLDSTEKCCENAAAHNTCYRYQIMATSKLVAEKLGLKKEQWQFSFQSRIGKNSWLKPATQARLRQMPAEGIKNLLVVCPSFTSDCLETLEEINMRGRKDFLDNGGESFTYIPCLNTNKYWVKTIVELINAIP